MSKVNIEDLLESLSLEEKVGQLVQLGGEFFSENLKTVETGPSEKIGLRESFDRFTMGSVINVLNPKEIESIQNQYLEGSSHKIPLLFMADIIHGFQTIFPIPLGQAASFDFDLIEEAASISARESYYGGQHVTFTPMIDLSRDARWGRISESPGEDPYVAQSFAKAAVRGLQGTDTKIVKEKIAATAKHYVGYGSVEAGREYNAVEMSESTLRQFHLPSFEAAVKANVRLVMTAFHTLNGVPATGSEWINKDILRDELNFKGVMISDHSAIKELVHYGYAKDDREAALIGMKAHVDIDMKTSVYANEIIGLIESGDLDIELLDDAVRRVLELKDDLGLFENPLRGLNESKEHLNYENHEGVALELAEKSIVLLKNNGILPLKDPKNIAVIGPNAQNQLMFGLWAINGDTSQYETLFDAFKKHYPQACISSATGASLIDNFENYGFPEKFSAYFNSDAAKQPSKDVMLEDALACAKDSDVVILAIGENMLDSGEGGSKVNLELSEDQVNLIHKIHELGKPIVGVINSGRPNILTDIEPYFDALLYGWYGGVKMSEALVNVISGKVNPSGKLPVSLPRHVGQLPLYYNNYKSARPVMGQAKKRFTSRYIDVENTALYPFGYGLSYTQFDYNNLSVVEKDSLIEINVEVTNKGNCGGEDVAQVYIHVPYAKIVRPDLELKATQRVHLNKGQSKTVSFTLNHDDLKFYANRNEKVIEPGDVEIYVGNSSVNLPVKETIIIE